LSHELKTLIEAPQYVEYKGSIIDWFTKISKGVSHALHLATVVIDREVALGEVAEFSIKQQRPGLAVAQELLRNPEPGHASSDAVVRVDDVKEVGGDAVEDPRDDHAIHAIPGRIGGAGLIAEDVILQRVPAEGKKEIPAPLGVVGGFEVEDDGDQVLDVLNRAGLIMQVRNSGGLRGDGALVVVFDVFVAGGFQAEPLADFGRLGFQGVGLRALLG
jgi:hypothetical protein